MNIKKQLSRWSKDWGVRLAAVAATLTGVVTSNQDLLIGLIAFLPSGPARLLVAVGLAVAVFGVPTLTQVLQDKLAGNTDDKSTEAE